MRLLGALRSDCGGPTWLRPPLRLWVARRWARPCWLACPLTARCAVLLGSCAVQTTINLQLAAHMSHVGAAESACTNRWLDPWLPPCCTPLSQDLKGAVLAAAGLTVAAQLAPFLAQAALGAAPALEPTALLAAAAKVGGERPALLLRTVHSSSNHLLREPTCVYLPAHSLNVLRCSIPLCRACYCLCWPVRRSRPLCPARWPPSRRCSKSLPWPLCPWCVAAWWQAAWRRHGWQACAWWAPWQQRKQVG